LARGDVFKKPFFIRLLTALKILPVYRSSEGVENLSENYKTFEACVEILRKKGIITIFSEGKCVNEWHLRPLKKGTARLAIKAWQENIDLSVIPVGINYSSFTRFGKNVFINFGVPIRKENIDFSESDGVRHQIFNKLLSQQLAQSVFEIPKSDTQRQKSLLELKPSLLLKFILSIPAAIGYLIHLPLFLQVKKIAWKRTHNNDHYDSVMVGILLLTYPLYLLFFTSVIWAFTTNWLSIFLLLIFPFTAWSYVQLKAQLDK